MKIFEIGMLLCFGASWPASVYKSWRARTTAGKSLLFLFLVFAGYISGLIYKVSTGFDYVSYFYIFNALLVFSDIMLYFHNGRLMAKGQNSVRDC